MSNNPYRSASPPDDPTDDWRDQAACRNRSINFWFPEDSRGPTDTVLAKRICASCPVQVPCLQYALDTRQRYGIWGGKNRNERLDMLRRPARITPDHVPSHVGYNRHLAANEVPCVGCRREHAKHTAEKRKHKNRKKNPTY